MQTIEPSKADSGRDSINKFAKDLKQRLLRGRFRTVKSFAINHTVTGLSRSTVYSAISGSRLPTPSTVQTLLSAVAEADETEISKWLDRRALLENGSVNGHGAEDSTKPARTRVLTLGYGAAALVSLVLIGIGAALGAVIARPRQPAAAASAPSAPASTTMCTPLADLRPYQVQAKVTNTQGQGTFVRIQPQTACHTGFLAENDPVTVVCQDLHGPTITDVYQGKVRNWSVWDKLGSGGYVSDLYVDLPKGPEPALVANLPACP